jgi:hypothetical protein
MSAEHLRVGLLTYGLDRQLMALGVGGKVVAVPDAEEARRSHQE